ncbi:MAG TPA: tetratricopeptide repeat protein, partial [Pyrinomonadaceae bacterium]|nr:tetratricopeptide repeat protein [Pyrinomonadaceae bacterium]
MSIGSLKFVASVLSAGLLMNSFSYTSAATLAVGSNFTIQQTDQADVALREGRRLLKRGRSDQALVQLRNALNLYTNAKNQSGVAAAHNEIGDLYLRQGQYTVALDHYQKALDGFLGVDKKNEAVNAVVGIADDKFNANLMLAKIGDVNFRLGRTSEAMSAYGRMVVKKPESAGSKVTRRFGGLG